MSTRNALTIGLLSLFVATALSGLSIKLAAAEEPPKPPDNCKISFMEDPCRHGGQAHAVGPIKPKPGDVQAQGDQTPNTPPDNCKISVMEDPCRHPGAAYVNGGQSRAQAPRTPPDNCAVSVMEDPCRQALKSLKSQTIGLSKY